MLYIYAEAYDKIYGFPAYVQSNTEKENTAMTALANNA